MIGRLRRRFVRQISLVILASIMGFTVEPVVGLARDGAVHHETAAEAATHAGLASADHAHETDEAYETDDAQSPADSDAGHEHGSNADHCTHAHGVALHGAFAVEIATNESTLFTFDPAVTERTTITTSLTPPPQA